MATAIGGVRIGLAGLATAMVMIGYVATQPATVAAQACHERHEAAPIDEDGTECPGNPTIWKSHSFRRFWRRLLHRDRGSRTGTDARPRELPASRWSAGDVDVYLQFRRLYPRLLERRAAAV